MKLYSLQHAVECLYQSNFTNSFNCNTIQNSKLDLIYINDPMYLMYKDEYISRGYEVIDRFDDQPYEMRKVNISSLFPFKSVNPICLENSNSLKYMFIDDHLYIHFPERVMGLMYNGCPTYLGLINFNINHD